MQKGITKNVLANYVGKFGAALSVYIVTPLYLQFLGVEVYGLVGVFVLFQGLISFADMGLTATLNRELARLSVIDDSSQEMRNLVRTLEMVFMVILLIIIAVTFIFAPDISTQWINVSGITSNEAAVSICLMGVAIAFAFFSNLYIGGLMGLQNQVLANGIMVSMGLLRGFGAVLVLWLISPTIYAFLIWQIIVNLTQTIIYRYSLWRKLPYNEQPAKVSLFVLKGIWKFALGLAAISLFSALLTQMDKLAISKLLPLKELGYYSLASVVGQVPSILVQPLSVAFLPRLAQLAQENILEKIAKNHHRMCQFVSVLTFPVVAVILVYSKEAMTIWTGSASTAETVYVAVNLLIIGGAFLALMVIPYNLAIAYGWTRLNVIIGGLSVIIILPLLIFLVLNYGINGAASAWMILNGCVTIFYPIFLYKKLLKKHYFKWLIQDVLKPAIAVTIVAVIWFFIKGNNLPVYMVLISMIGLGILTLFAAFWASPMLREYAIYFINSKKGKKNND